MKFFGILSGAVFLILVGYLFWLTVLFNPAGRVRETAVALEQQWGLEIKTGYSAFKLGWPSRIEIDGVIVRDAVTQERYFSSERLVFEIPLWGFFTRSWPLPRLRILHPVLTLPQNSRFSPQSLLLGALDPWDASQAGEAKSGQGRAFSKAGLGDLREIRVEGGSLLWQAAGEVPEAAPRSVEIGLWDGMARLDPKRRVIDWETRGIWQTPKINFVASGVWHLKEDRLEFTLQLDETTEVLGTLSPVRREPVFEGTIQMRQVDLASAWFRSRLPLQDLEGRLTLRLESRMAVVWPPHQIFDTLDLKGAVAIRNGFWTGHNLVHDLLKTLEPMPEVSVLFLEEMPADSAQILRASGTQFEVMNFNMTAKGDQFKLTDLVLSDENYWITGDAAFNLRTGDLNSNARLVLRESVSGFLADRIEDLAVLRNPKGRLVLPFQYSSLHGRPGALKLDLTVLEPTILEKN